MRKKTWDICKKKICANIETFAKNVQKEYLSETRQDMRYSPRSLRDSSYSYLSSRPSKVKLSRDTNEEVKVQRTFVNYETGAPLLPSDIDKFQEYGGKRIRFTMDEVKGMTAMQQGGDGGGNNNVGLRLCGFKPLSTLR